MTFLGIDIGTSAVKAVLVDERQAVLAEAVVPLSVSRPRPGWSEQDPEDWWRAVEAAVHQLRMIKPDALRGVRGIGLAGQMHGAVLLDASDQPVRPAILWNDGRATEESAALQESLPDLPRIAGVIAMPGFTAPKLLWVRRHEPERFARIATVLLAKDYIRLKLTGAKCTDMSDAAGALLLDQQARAWSQPIVEATGLEPRQLPALLEGSANSGEVRASVLADWGMEGPIVVAGGAGDAPAAAIGIGAVEDGDAFLSLGTSGQFFVTTDRYRPRPETLLHAFAHALPGRWFQMAAMLNGASCLEWCAGILGEPDIPALLQRTEAAFRGPSDVLFLPYLSGERTPHNDPHARGVLFGMHPGTGRTDFVQAVLEGVAFSFADAQACLAEAGIRPKSVAAVGGGARSRFWMKLIASVLGIPVIRYAGAETGPAFGAARLAPMAVTGETLGEVCSKPAVADVSQPDPALCEAYRGPIEAYRGLYRALKDEFRRA